MNNYKTFETVIHKISHIEASLDKKACNWIAATRSGLERGGISERVCFLALPLINKCSIEDLRP